MSAGQIPPERLGVFFKLHGEAQRDNLNRAVAFSKQAGVTLLKRRTPVDQGVMRAAWEATEDGIQNTAPHAGIVEGGARPHKVNQAGLQALYEWVVRHGLAKVEKGPGAVRRGPGRGKEGPVQLIQRMGPAQMVQAKAADFANDSSGASKAAWAIVWAIAKKLEKQGQKPTHFVRDSIPDLLKLVERYVRIYMKPDETVGKLVR